MKPANAKRLRLLAFTLFALVLVVFAVGTWFYFQMRKSLPALDGEVTQPGLSAGVALERDAQGAVTLKGETRSDVALALGFAHAQDRFFQMDCARRHAAGELAELLGKESVAHDRKVRIYQFRNVARQALALLPADQRALLEAYTNGVNAGLSSLSSKPFEYVLLRSTPAPWKAEDSLLILYAQAIDLETDNIVFEHSLATMSDCFGKSAVAYFAPLVGPEDAAADASVAPLAPMPSERLIDIRKRVYEFEDGKKHASIPHRQNDGLTPGSNAFAVSAARSADGRAILANDMHRKLEIPSLWYRASFHFKGASGAPVAVSGLTLPGLPLMISGSNGHIAWGFTNACADVADLVVVNPASGPGTYMDHGKPKMYEMRTESIAVRNAEPVSVEYGWTTWGPVIGTNADKRDYALKWTLHDPNAINLSLLGLETATTISAAVDVAHHAGMPVQNILIAGSDGQVAWTLCGFLPKRLGYDGRLPATWDYGDRNWVGFTPAGEIPVRISPATGCLWSANQRLFSGPELASMGDGGYAMPYRAARLRDLLSASETLSQKDLFAAQLDTRSPSLDRWQQLLLSLLTPEVTTQKRERAQLHDLIEKWDGRADTNSVSYRLVAAFREHVTERVMPVVFEPCYDVYPDFDFTRFNYEPALWDMIQKRPAHLIGQDYGSWDDLLLAAVDDVIAEAKRESGALKAASWGDHNRARIRHPLARCFPGPLGWWLKAPADPLAGDNLTIRVQAPDFGASERMVVSPGHEQEGILETPGGQSGHPLSPYYRANHEAWVKGSPTPFLPGTPEHTLILKP